LIFYFLNKDNFRNATKAYVSKFYSMFAPSLALFADVVYKTLLLFRGLEDSVSLVLNRDISL
jgi:hypothetical protein